MPGLTPKIVYSLSFYLKKGLSLGLSSTLAVQGIWTCHMVFGYINVGQLHTLETEMIVSKLKQTKNELLLQITFIVTEQFSEAIFSNHVSVQFSFKVTRYLTHGSRKAYLAPGPRPLLTAMPFSCKNTVNKHSYFRQKW